MQTIAPEPRSEQYTPFAVSTAVSGTTRTIGLVGELDLSTVPQLDQAVHEALGDVPETLVLDLSATTFIESTGVRSILAAHRRCESLGVRFVVVPASPEAQRVFRLCGLEGVLPFVPGPRPAA